MANLAEEYEERLAPPIFPAIEEMLTTWPNPSSIMPKKTITFTVVANFVYVVHGTSPLMSFRKVGD